MNLVADKYLKLHGIENQHDFFSPEEIKWIEDKLTHQEERTSLQFDEWGNWNEKSASFDTSKPIVDYFILQKLGNLTTAGIWPQNAKFAFVLSHDVDRIESYSTTSFKRNIYKRLKHSKSLYQKLILGLQYIKTIIKGLFSNKNDDPLWCYEKWNKIEDKFGFKSTYFFYVLPKTKYRAVYDCDYHLNDQMIFNNNKIKVKDYISIQKEIGNEIGIHGSINTSISNSLYKDQSSQLKKILNEKVTISRQHYLMFSWKNTLNILINNKIEVDSTLGLNKSIGFRAGASFPYYLQKQGQFVLEIPLNIMDSAIFSEEISLDLAKSKIDEIIQHVETIGSCLTINFHPDYIRVKKYFKLYEYILENLSKRNCVCLSFSEVKKIIDKKCAE